MRSLAILALLAIAASGPAALAADKATRASPLLDALSDCRTKGDAERLACYDRATDAIAAARTKKDIVILDREDVRETRRGLFGFALPKLKFFGGNDDDPGVEETREIKTTVKSARALPYGKWRIVIADGAVWETTEASPGFNDPHPGAQLLIERGVMNGYFVKVDGKGKRVAAKRVG